ncbi:MepB family protein [Halobacteriovorax sp. HLS]|uniref:MepB family protein n=1 Tax=Halobacteriovorax sp. HLS TaxID=2234000 RepID=UPI000FD8B38B|nr:MepB family protein [Halobacteriovorax sp. HLS]
MNLLEVNENSVDAFVLNVEASDYKGCDYRINNISIIQRYSKTTAKKIGQFVSLWKRNNQGETCPLDLDDKFDYIIIICVRDNLVGHFLFSKEVLADMGYISDGVREGKRGFRVYPSWDSPTSKQAIQTQQWQMEYFKSTATLDLNE